MTAPFHSGGSGLAVWGIDQKQQAVGLLVDGFEPRAHSLEALPFYRPSAIGGRSYATEIENQGIALGWDGMDPQGRIPVDLTQWSRLTPEGKETYKPADDPCGRSQQ